jgi:hypothetical protein
MEDGSIDNNKSIYSAGKGGGVNTSGSFEMKGGTIKNNTAGTESAKTSAGGGVYMNKGTFTMSGGSIENNTVLIKNGNTGAGGGVSVAGTFAMSGTARIANNTATRGGGVMLGNDAKFLFTMKGGEIAGNKAIAYDTSGNETSAYGGAVLVYGTATFTKEGGTIYGKDAGDNSNTVSGTAGHAIDEITASGKNITLHKYYDDTAGNDLNLNSESENWGIISP